MLALSYVAAIATAFAARSPFSNVLLFVILSASAIFYTLIWRSPRRWVALVAPADPCAVMALVAHALKLAQLTAVARVTDWASVARAVSANAALTTVAVALFVFGQHLNALVYARLGARGVYYGSKLGKPVPWIRGYPFSVVRDPQYVGALCCVAACATFLPADIVAFTALQYAYLIALESTTGGAAAPAEHRKR